MMNDTPQNSDGMTLVEFAKWASENYILYSSGEDWSSPAVKFLQWSTKQHAHLSPQKFFDGVTKNGTVIGNYVFDRETPEGLPSWILAEDVTIAHDAPPAVRDDSPAWKRADPPMIKHTTDAEPVMYLKPGEDITEVCISIPISTLLITMDCLRNGRQVLTEMRDELFESPGFKDGILYDAYDTKIMEYNGLIDYLDNRSCGQPHERAIQ